MLNVTNSHAQLLCNFLFVQLELDLKLIFRFLCYDQITCLYFTTRVIVKSSGYVFDRSINKFNNLRRSYEFITFNSISIQFIYLLALQ